MDGWRTKDDGHISNTISSAEETFSLSGVDKMADWAKWARYSIPHSFLNICHRKSIFLSFPVFSGWRKPIFTLILQLKELLFVSGCIAINLPSSNRIPTHIWLYECHSCMELENIYLKWNHNRWSDKVIKSQNCDADSFCAAHGNDPPGSNWPQKVLWGLM